MCGNELDLVDSFSVMLEWVEPALSKKWLCLLVLMLITFANSLDPDQTLTKHPNKTSDLCFPDEPVQPPVMLKNSKFCSVNSLTVIEYSSD